MSNVRVLEGNVFIKYRKYWLLVDGPLLENVRPSFSATTRVSILIPDNTFDMQEWGKAVEKFEYPEVAFLDVVQVHALVLKDRDPDELVYGKEKRR